MAATFELKKSQNDQYMFNLTAPNGQIILTSELYTTKAAAENGIELVKKNGCNDANFEHRMSAKGEAYFILKAANKQIIGRSEMYSIASAMEKGIASVIKNCADAIVKDITE